MRTSMVVLITIEHKDMSGLSRTSTVGAYSTHMSRVSWRIQRLTR